VCCRSRSCCSWWNNWARAGSRETVGAAIKP
jgi:hypothetical protein